MLIIEKLVDKEILCLLLNFPLAYHMHAENLEDKCKISPLHEVRGLHSLGEQKNPRRSWYYNILISIYKIYIYNKKKNNNLNK